MSFLRGIGRGLKGKMMELIDASMVSETKTDVVNSVLEELEREISNEN